MDKGLKDYCGISEFFGSNKIDCNHLVQEKVIFESMLLLYYVCWFG